MDFWQGLGWFIDNHLTAYSLLWSLVLVAIVKTPGPKKVKAVNKTFRSPE